MCHLFFKYLLTWLKSSINITIFTCGHLFMYGIIILNLVSTESRINIPIFGFLKKKELKHTIYLQITGSLISIS